MKSFLRVTAVAALLALALAPGRALASGSGTATLPVTASVTSGCLLATVGLNFGSVSPLVVEEDTVTGYTATGIIEIACGTNGPTSGGFIAISLDDGANGAIAPILGVGTSSHAVRAMTNGTSFLAYDIYGPSLGTSPIAIPTAGIFVAGATAVIGTNTGQEFTSQILTPDEYSGLLANNGISGGPGSAFVAFPVFGSIPGDQVQPLTPGIYTDTVNVSITF